MRIAEHHQKLEQTREHSPLQFQKEHFDSDFWPPDLWDNKFMLF